MPELVHWNPRRRLGSGPVLRRIPLRSRIENFGDMLGPWIVRRICETRGLGAEVASSPRLLSVGSIMRLGRGGDVVWGTGVNGKSADKGPFPIFDVRAVRGPLSAEVLRKSGNSVPEVFGDPALLIPHLWSDKELGIVRGSGGLLFVPNLHDRGRFPADAMDPTAAFVDCVRAIASATHVVGSSLHAMVIADAYGVPSTLVRSQSEPTFKYEDYYRGTGRAAPAIVPTWEAGISAETAAPITNWDASALLDAFPSELWA